MKRAQVFSFPISIFIAGDYENAAACCQAYCDAVGWCVTVTPTSYVYSGGREDGVVVGLINYPRFPNEGPGLEAIAIELGMKLRETLGQESFSVQTPTTTTWFSWREADLASVDGRRMAETVQLGSGRSPTSAVPEGQTPSTSHTGGSHG